jgi:hypothetical protein
MRQPSMQHSMAYGSPLGSGDIRQPSVATAYGDRACSGRRGCIQSSCVTGPVEGLGRQALRRRM